jgi:predicted transcriptional regulator YdeE
MRKPMEPKIVHQSSLNLVGMSFYGDPFDTSGAWMEENQIGRLWVRFMSYLHQRGDCIQSRTAQDVTYEVHVYNEETLDKGIFEVFAGVQVERLDVVPFELLVKVLPASDYAVFTLYGKQILSDWDTHIDRWLAEAGYQRRHPFSFLRYDERFKGMDHIAESALDVYMPVSKAAR